MAINLHNINSPEDSDGVAYAMDFGGQKFVYFFAPPTTMSLELITVWLLLSNPTFSLAVEIMDGDFKPPV